MTKYIVFRNVGGDQGHDEEWHYVDEVEARSTREAIKLALNDKNVEGEFAAVPRRSWQPVKVQVETALKFS